MEKQNENVPDGLLEILRKAFPNYENLRYWKKGGTHLIFRATQQPSGDERTISVDRTDLETFSDRAKRHMNRGYTALADSQAFANDPLAEQNGILTAIGSSDLTSLGYPGTAAERRWYPSKTLHELIEENGAGLPIDKTAGIMKQAFKTSEYLESRGLVHRDMSAHNILVGDQPENKGVVRITDNSNTGKVGELEEKFIPTMGSATISFPPYLSQLTGKAEKYGFQGEVHALAENALLALRGKPVVELDPDKKIGKIIDTNESLFDSQGNFDWKGYEAAHFAAIDALKVKRKMKKTLKKAITLDKNLKYSAPSVFSQAFEKALQPSGLEVIAKNWKTTVASVAALGIAGLTSYAAIQHMQAKVKEKTLKEKEDYLLVTDWLNKGQKLESNLIDVQVNAMVYPKEFKIGHDVEKYPQNKYLKVSPGDSLYIHLSAYQKPIPAVGKYRPFMTFPGKIYIEGRDETNFAPVELGVMPINSNSNPANAPEMYYSQNRSSATFIIPTNMPEGVYTAIVDVYPPTFPNANKEDRDMKIKVEGDGAIEERRIPFVVGNPKDQSYLKSLSLEYLSGYAMFDTFTNEIEGLVGAVKDTSFVFNVPELNHNDTNDHQYGGVFLPNPNDTKLGKYTLMTYAQSKEGTKFVTSYPLELSTNRTYNFREWKLGRPSTNQNEKVIEFRKKYER